MTVLEGGKNNKPLIPPTSLYWNACRSWGDTHEEDKLTESKANSCISPQPMCVQEPPPDRLSGTNLVHLFPVPLSVASCGWFEKGSIRRKVRASPPPGSHWLNIDQHTMTHKGPMTAPAHLSNHAPLSPGCPPTGLSESQTHTAHHHHMTKRVSNCTGSGLSGQSSNRKSLASRLCELCWLHLSVPISKPTAASGLSQTPKSWTRLAQRKPISHRAWGGHTSQISLWGYS